MDVIRHVIALSPGTLRTHAAERESQGQIDEKKNILHTTQLRRNELE